jgi:uncharacterized protein (DUF433 family)
VSAVLAASGGAAYISAMSTAAISSDPDVMGGALVFAGTRVPVATLFDYLEAGKSIDDFLDGFRTVKRTQVIDLLEAVKGDIGKLAA